jgi:GNAT superfamily N-acetyltransferase
MSEIRKAKIKDIDTILILQKELMKSQIEIIKTFRPEHLTDIKPKRDMEKEVISFISSSVRSKNGLVLLAEIDGKPAGYLLVLIKKNIPIFKLEKLGEITEIYVRQQYRGTGISTNLKNEAFKWLKSRGIKKVTLNVFPDNKKGLPIYKKWGFSPYIYQMRRNL